MADHYFANGPSVELYDLRIQEERLPQIRGDVAFYKKQAKRTGGPVLELGCGTGRVALPLAEAGLDVTGLDLSPFMLKVARAKSKAKIRWVRGNMAKFNLRRKFRTILIPFRGFQHLLTPEAQRSCLECVRRHLAPGGRFIVNLFDPRLEYLHPEGNKTPVTRENFTHPVTGEQVNVDILARRNDVVNQVLEEDWLWTRRDREGHILGTFRDTISMRWTFRWEMNYLLELTGFKVLDCFGDFHGGKARYGAEQIWVCR